MRPTLGPHAASGARPSLSRRRDAASGTCGPRRPGRPRPSTSRTDGGRAVLPRPADLPRLGARRQEHRAHALRHPLQREHRRHLLHPRGQVVEHEEHAGDELQDQHDRASRRRSRTSPSGGPTRTRRRRACRRRCPARTPTRTSPRPSPSSAAATPKQQRRRRQQQRGLDERGHQHLADLAEEERGRRQRRAAQALEAAVVALDRDGDREVLEAREHDAGRQHAGQEVLRERDPRRRARPSRRPARTPSRRSRA